MTIEETVKGFFDHHWDPHGVDVDSRRGFVTMAHGKFDPNAVTGKGPEELGLSPGWLNAGRKEWLKRMIAYWGDDLGVPTNPGPLETHFYHREYDVKEARKECLWPDKEFGPFRYRAHDNRLDHTSLFYLFPEGRARANVPADKDKRVRLSYLQDLFAADSGSMAMDRGRRPLLAELWRLSDEVSPWGNPATYQYTDGFVEADLSSISRRG